MQCTTVFFIARASMVVNFSVFVSHSEEIPPVCNCSCGKTERKEETTTTATHEFKVPHSRTTNLSSVKKKEKKVEVEEGKFKNGNT